MALNFIPLINGQSFDWANITLTLLGSPMTQVTKIDYSSKQDKKDNYGWYNQPISRSYGNVTYSGSIEMYLDTWRSICQAAPNGDPLQIPWFNVSINYGNFQQSNVINCRDVLYNVEFLDNPMNATQGETGLKVTIPIIFSGLERFI